MPLFIAVDELYKGKVKLLTDEEEVKESLDMEETLEEMEELDLNTEEMKEQLAEELAEFEGTDSAQK